MLEPDAAEIVGDRQQEVVMVVMLRAEQLDRLVDQPLVRGDLLGRGGELGRRCRRSTSRRPSLLSGIWR